MTTRSDRPLLGWPLWVFPDTNGEIKYPTLENSVRQSIEIILRTRPGEQLMKPDFGAGLANFLHEPNTLTTRTRIRDTILAALERWESRIFLDRVDVEEIPDEPARIQIEIAYRLRRTGVPQQVALTVELER